MAKSTRNALQVIKESLQPDLRQKAQDPAVPKRVRQSLRDVQRKLK